MHLITHLLIIFNIFKHTACALHHFRCLGFKNSQIISVSPRKHSLRSIKHRIENNCYKRHIAAQEKKVINLAQSAVIKGVILQILTAEITFDCLRKPYYLTLAISYTIGHSLSLWYSVIPHFLFFLPFQLIFVFFANFNILLGPGKTIFHQIPSRPYLQKRLPYSRLLMSCICSQLPNFYRHNLFHCTSPYCTLQILYFLQIKGFSDPAQSKFIGSMFSNSIPLLLVSVSHFGNSHNTSNFFIIVIFVNGDL